MRCVCSLLLLTVLAGILSAGTPTDDAIALYRAKRYPHARTALESIVAAEPANAAACYYLGMTFRHRSESGSLTAAVKWLKRAVELEPGNSTYLADYGGTSLQFSNQTRSLSAAIAGRDAMEKAIQLNPGNLEAREGLRRFYDEAPWPLGSRAKAKAQLEEISRRDPDRGAVLRVLMKVRAKDFEGAFALCDDVLEQKPDNYAALYQYGRTTTLCGQNLDRGLACLQKCLTLTPSPDQSSHAQIWLRIGNIYELRHQPTEARAAYASALKLEPDNGPAAAALTKLP